MIRSILLSTVTFFISLSCLAQNRFDDVVIKETKLTDHIYMLEGAGGNIGLYIGEEEVLIIDDQFAPLSERIMAKIDELSGQKVTKVINTHWHGDHTGGNENFGKAGAMIFAHENVYGRMSTEQVRGERVTPPSPDIALPVVTYSDQMQLYFMGEPVLVTHVHNGHTDGDSFVFFPESNVLHMGDCFFHKRLPYIDVGSGGSINGILEAAETALMLVDDHTQIIPGHGPMATKSDLQGYHTFLKTTRDKMAEHLSNGRDTSTMDPDKLIEGYEDWAWGFINAERFANIVYESLTEDH